jgi:DNA-binding LacI/PurR family transcriptional regulator
MNSNEIKVLQALIEEVMDCTNGQFGYIGDVDRGEFSQHEFAGYISALKAKGVFKYLDTEGDFDGQYAIKEEYLNQA